MSDRARRLMRRDEMENYESYVGMGEVELNPVGDLAAKYEESLKQAYKLGLLRGMNTQAMVQAEMKFSD